MVDVIKWHWGPPTSKISNPKYQNKDRLPVCGIFLPQLQPKLGCSKPSTGPRVGHRCFGGSHLPQVKSWLILNQVLIVFKCLLLHKSIAWLANENSRSYSWPVLGLIQHFARFDLWKQYLICAQFLGVIVLKRFHNIPCGFAADVSKPNTCHKIRENDWKCLTQH